MTPAFRDRRDAGRVLGTAILAKSNLGQAPVVLALPRGGIPVAFEIAATLKAPLDVCVVRRIELPEGGGFLNVAVIGGRVIVGGAEMARSAKISDATLLRIVQRESREVGRRQRAYRGNYPEVEIVGRTVVLVDDGLAAPEAFIAAVRAIRARGAARLLVALPVAETSSYRRLFAIVDDVVCLEISTPFRGVGASYADFAEVSDLDVRALHEAARNRRQVLD
jgi:predicted phosphoribosyltransferase